MLSKAYIQKNSRNLGIFKITMILEALKERKDGFEWFV